MRIKLGATMKMNKGSYRVITQLGWQTKKGTVGYDFPFYVFRQEGETSATQWCVSHMASGFSIKKRLSLKSARSLVKELKNFPLFLLPDAESIAKEQERMRQRGEYSRLLTIINGA
jgi:hypothetical protein